MMPSEAKRQQRAVLIVVLATYMMILLDTSIVITGLTEIRAELGFSAVMLSWVQTSYMLAFGGFLMLGARAGDLFGRKRAFLAGLTLFTLSSFVIGAAPNAAGLLAARAMQGLGAAILAPSTLALLQVLRKAKSGPRHWAFTPRRRASDPALVWCWAASLPGGSAGGLGFSSTCRWVWRFMSRQGIYWPKHQGPTDGWTSSAR